MINDSASLFQDSQLTNNQLTNNSVSDLEHNNEFPTENDNIEFDKK